MNVLPFTPRRPASPRAASQPSPRRPVFIAHVATPRTMLGISLGLPQREADVQVVGGDDAMAMALRTIAEYARRAGRSIGLTRAVGLAEPADRQAATPPTGRLTLVE